MNIPDNFSESLETVMGSGWKKSDSGSGMFIPDPIAKKDNFFAIMIFMLVSDMWDARLQIYIETYILKLLFYNLAMIFS